MSFYVTLTSNASLQIYPQNNAGHFFVKLPQTIELTSQYEVGLVDIQFPNTYFNILKDEVWIKYFPPPDLDEPPMTITLTPGLYKSTEKFIGELNRLVFEAERFINERQWLRLDDALQEHNRMMFSYNDISNKARFQLYEQGAEVRLSDKLAEILQFPSTHVTETEPSLSGVGEVDLDQGTKNVFVYSDIVTSRVVGDVMVPLLRTLPVLDRSTTSVFRMYDKPHYVPLSRFSFDTIELLITDEQGKPIPFTGGTSVVTLHFRTTKRFDLG